MDSQQEWSVKQAIDEHRAANGATHHDLNTVAIGARRLVREVWLLVDARIIDARSPAADAALDLRDSIDPSWHPSAITRATSDYDGKGENNSSASSHIGPKDPG